MKQRLMPLNAALCVTIGTWAAGSEKPNKKKPPFETRFPPLPTPFGCRFSHALSSVASVPDEDYALALKYSF
uniref:Putative secreted protein n=1 Tax=Anopheles darlingi TaxID=43151 RepID=A0A2M4D791_ANODA